MRYSANVYVDDSIDCRCILLNLLSNSEIFILLQGQTMSLGVSGNPAVWGSRRYATEKGNRGSEFNHNLSFGDKLAFLRAGPEGHHALQQKKNARMQSPE